MAIPQGAFYWNGVKALLSGSYSLQLGVNPGIATLAIPPQPSGIKMKGTLQIRFGKTLISLPKCNVIKFDYHADRKVWLLHIADERWRWRFGVANAWYNRRLSNGILDKAHSARPRFIADQLAKAFGVDNLDVSKLPDDSFPYMDLEWKERPDVYLSQLCESLGCRIAYNPNKPPKVVIRGHGSPLPNKPQISYQKAIDPGDAPSKIVFVGGRSLWNVDVDLEAVGEDVDGMIRPINQLSYKPPGGWGWSDPPRFTCCAIGANKKLQQLAQMSVFRWYRPRVPFNIDAKRAVQNLWQILPITGYQVIPTNNLLFVEQAAKDNFLTQPAWVYGSWLKHHDNNKPVTINVAGNLIAVAAGIMMGGYGIDQERGIIQFSEPMYLRAADETRVQADLKIRMAVSYRDLVTRQCEHFTQEQNIPGGDKDAKPRYIVREDLGYRQGRDISTGLLNGPMFNNILDLATMAQVNISRALIEYDLQTPEVATYPGFINVEVDGAIQQVRWWVTENGEPYTLVSRNTESAPVGGTWAEQTFFNQMIKRVFNGNRDEGRQPV